uniref:Metalloendopeptidase n=1 Tax=Megaselia scalaris TaxID=36166 RepID=T1GGU3_MEGSC
MTWPKATIYYKFHDKFNSQYKTKIMKALKKIMEVSCLKFKEGGTWFGLGPHIKIKRDDKQCSSVVGYKGYFGEMNMYLGKCDEIGIIHEFLHAAGLKHEHNARIRDKYININWSNIIPKKQSNFQKYNIDTNFGLPYDFESIMHYASNSLSKNGKPTIVRKNNKKRYITKNKKMSKTILYNAENAKKIIDNCPWDNPSIVWEEIIIIILTLEGMK